MIEHHKPTEINPFLQLIVPVHFNRN